MQRFPGMITILKLLMRSAVMRKERVAINSPGQLDSKRLHDMSVYSLKSLRSRNRNRNEWL